MIKRVITGGQTGADQGALRAARDLGVQTGGWAPAEWRTETGPAPWLADFDLTEHGEGYAGRTTANVEEADVVLIIGVDSPGSRLTESEARRLGRPCVWIGWTDGMWLSNVGGPRVEVSYDIAFGRILNFLRDHEPQVLMVAGNRASRNPGVDDAAYTLVADLLEEVV